MKRASYEGITLAGATSRGVSAKKQRGRKAETIFFFAETSRDDEHDMHETNRVMTAIVYDILLNQIRHC
jgi:hypothetical protein